MWKQTTLIRGNETSGCVAVEMIRRGGGRTPPFILVGLVVVLLILGFNYWTLSSQNADLQQDLEKLQTEVKISAVKQDQSEKKNKALHDTVHEMESISGKLKKKLQEEDDLVKTKDQDNQKKAYEISSLKTQIVHLQEQIGSLTQQVEEREVEVAKVKETNGHLVSQRDDAVEAIAEKDTQINTLRRQLEQMEEKLTAQKREAMAAAPQKFVPGPFNLPGVEQKAGLSGVNDGKEVAAEPPLPPDDPNHPQLQPPGPAVMERPAPPLAADSNLHPLQPPNNSPNQQQQQQQEVLAPPPQMPPHQDNLDAAVDPEGGRGGGDDLTGDQDEEGNEVRQRPNDPEEGAGGGPEDGAGAVELPPRPILPHGDYFYHNLDNNINNRQPGKLN